MSKSTPKAPIAHVNNIVSQNIIAQEKAKPKSLVKQPIVRKEENNLAKNNNKNGPQIRSNITNMGHYNSNSKISKIPPR